MNVRTTVRTTAVAAALTGGAAIGFAGLSPAGAQTGGATPGSDRVATFCAELDQHRADADERLADLQIRIDLAQERLADRRVRAEERGAAETVAVIDARLARLTSAEVDVPARVAAAFARAEEACAALPAP